MAYCNGYILHDNNCHAVKIAISTGSHMSSISEEAATATALAMVKYDTPKQTTDDFGQTFTIESVTVARLKLKDYVVTIPLEVVPGLPAGVVLGIDWFMRRKVQIGTDGKFRVKDDVGVRHVVNETQPDPAPTTGRSLEYVEKTDRQQRSDLMDLWSAQAAEPWWKMIVFWC